MSEGSYTCSQVHTSKVPREGKSHKQKKGFDSVPLTKSVEASPRWKIRRAGETTGLGDDTSSTNLFEILLVAAMEEERERERCVAELL